MLRTVALFCTEYAESHREEDGKVATLQHTTLATARLRVLFLAAKIWRHAGRVGVGYRLEIGDLAVIREHPLA